MGIQGLTTFLDINSQLLTTYRLRDIKVIIDGNNLFHFLNILYKIQDDLGGNYDCFAAATRSFFGALAQCNVQPMVVFDGPYNPKEKKINTAIKRAKERIQLAYNLTTGHRGRATPILSHDVFISVLDDMEIDHVTCEGEADPEIAALAKKYECPVMTNDSDFFIFNLHGGVILLDYINIQINIDKEVTRAAQTSPNYISTQIYYFRKFHELFKMDTDLFALFGTILGNDRVDIKVFDPFFAGVHLPKAESNKLFSGQRQTKMLRVLLWLETAGTMENAVKKILHQYKVEQRENLKKAIMDSVDNYKCIAEPKTRTTAGKSYASDLQTYNGHPFPEWFLAELLNGKVSNLTINAAVSRKVILHAQPENFLLPSAHCCARSMRKLIYGVILLHDTKFHEQDNGSSCCSATCAWKESQRNLYIEEIDRELRHQQRHLTEPSITRDDTSIPSLAQMPQVNTKERLNLLCSAHGVKPDILSTCPQGLELYMLALVYWVNQSEPHIDWLQLKTVIVCLLKLTCLDPYINGIGSAVQSGTSTQCESCPSKDQQISQELIIGMMQSQNLCEIVTTQCNSESVIVTKQNLDKFLQPAKSKNPAAQNDMKTLHGFAQLQACVLASQALNQVLGSPLARIPVSKVYNGTFLFCFYHELRCRKKPDAYIIEVLHRCPVLNAITQTLSDLVHSSVAPNVLVLDITPGSKRSKKKRVKKDCVQNPATEENIVVKSPDDTGKKLLAKCDLVNRFECFMLADSN